MALPLLKGGVDMYAKRKTINANVSISGIGPKLALAVLSYLTVKPMHPYELSRTLRDNDDVRSIKFNHGSLYMVVGQLARAGFIAELESLPPAEENVAGDEWTAWFSDPKNRNVF